MELFTNPNGCVITDLWYGACTDQRCSFVTQKEQESKATAEHCLQQTILLTNNILMVS